MLVNSLKYSQLQIILYFLFAHIFVTQAMDPQTTFSKATFDFCFQFHVQIIFGHQGPTLPSVCEF